MANEVNATLSKKNKTLLLRTSLEQVKDYSDGKKLSTIISGIEGSIEGINGSISSLGTTVSGHTSSLSTLGTTVSGHTSTLSTIGATVSGHTTSLTSLNTTVGGHATSISSLSTTVGSHTSSIGSLNTRMSSAETQLNQLKVAGVYATLSGTKPANGLVNLFAKGSGSTASESGNPSMNSSVNVICVSDNEILYAGNMDTPASGAFLPFAKILYKSTDGLDDRIGYLSVVRNGSGNPTYSVVDKATNAKIKLNSSKTYFITIEQVIMIRSGNSAVLEGSSSISNAMLGVNNVSAVSGSTYESRHSISAPNPAVISSLSVPRSLQNTMRSSAYQYVSVSSTLLTGTSSSITGFEKGRVVKISDYLSFI